ncbi:hypothetical protein ACTUSN_23640 [Pantoea ananatis]|uniref:hypothetical protein n=1 Tax=Pantoea ananas TaxID=553 RepID=UPI003FA43BFF
MSKVQTMFIMLGAVLFIFGLIGKAANWNRWVMLVLTLIFSGLLFIASNQL